MQALCFFIRNCKTLRAVVVCFFIFLSANQLQAQNIEREGKEFPVPVGNPNQLFYLQRTENINTVVYELNNEKGILNATNPIRVFWLLFATSSRQENLSEMEKEFVYGVKIKSLEKNKCKFTLAAYPKIVLTLSKDSHKIYRVYVKPTTQQIILTQVYIKEKEGFLNIEPKVEYIEFSGTDVKSGKEVTERITP